MALVWRRLRLRFPRGDKVLSEKWSSQRRSERPEVGVTEAGISAGWLWSKSSYTGNPIRMTTERGPLTDPRNRRPASLASPPFTGMWPGGDQSDGQEEQRQISAQSDPRQVDDAEPLYDGRPGARAAPFLSLRHGPDRKADQPADRGRRDLLERGGSLQHLAQPPGPVGQDGSRSRRRHAARIHHHHRH